jgi:catechol 2,3-dioxygenase-like lactoylglutathione lyase family enzyme
MRVKTLSQVGMTVKSLKKSVDFYWENFGLPVMAVVDLPPTVIKEIYGLEKTKVKIAMLRCGWGNFIELFEFTPSEKGKEVKWNCPDITHLALEVGNVERAFKHLTAKGVKFLAPPMKVEGNTFAFLKDPDGHLVELTNLGFLYYINKFLGGIVGRINMATKFKKGKLL